MQLLLVAFAGALGTSLRYGLGRWLGDRGELPWHTLTANVAGSFLIVLAAFWLQEHRLLGTETRTVLMTGALGGFTTYSAFNLEVLLMLQRAEWGKALLYFGVTAGGALLAGALALRLIRPLAG